ncbi:MAG: hypothetical protein KGJ79_07535 [Alphaproteobacteria bacterium]|nr:hypothetical protein [Alphaproteobacteria bacterium]MDE2493861.1 hypothetical protein [Alphaproteobacteria bacterium]
MRVLLLGFAVAGMAIMPAVAMHWVQYAPDRPNLYIDTDSTYTRGELTYYTWASGPADNIPPSLPGGNQGAINCTTGQTLDQVEEGQWELSDIVSRESRLYKAVCKP